MPIVLFAQNRPATHFWDMTHSDKMLAHINTLWTGDADLLLYITTVQDG